MKAAIAVGWKVLAESSLKHSDIHLPTTTWYCVRYKGAADSAVCIRYYRNCFLIFTILVLFSDPRRGGLSPTAVSFSMLRYMREPAQHENTPEKNTDDVCICVSIPPVRPQTERGYLFVYTSLREKARMLGKTCRNVFCPPEDWHLWCLWVIISMCSTLRIRVSNSTLSLLCDVAALWRWIQMDGF